MQRSFALYGHRGARGLAPENTIPGYAVAIKIGVDFVDMDVVMTKDHILVVQHELALDPDITRDNEGGWVHKGKLVSQMTIAELSQYDVGRIRPGTQYARFFPEQQPVDGTRIPSLLEVIQYVKQQSQKIKFQIEIKNDPEHSGDSYSPREMAQALADILYAENIIDCTEVQAFNWQCLYELQQIDARISTAYLTNSDSEKRMHHPDPVIAGRWTGGKLLKDYDYSIPKMIKALGGKLWDPQDVDMTPEKLHEAHKQGLKVVTWSSTYTSGKDIDLPLTENLIDMGVDGIITDRPDLLATKRIR